MNTCAAVALGLVSLTSAASAEIIVAVPGASNPWLAGMPNGSMGGSGFDSAPAQSPVLAPVAVFGGAVFSFSTTGAVSNGPGGGGPGPDGDTPPSFTFVLVENGMATLNAPLNSLIGIFLDDTQPDLSDAPAGLDFSVLGLDFASLSPLLKQSFFIGDGLTSGAATQTFTAPAGATRLYLGSMDGFQWTENSGEFSVTIVPAPAAAALVGLAGLAALRRRQR